MNRFCRAAHRLHQDVKVLESFWNSNDVVFVIDKVLGQVPVQQVDPSFVVGFFARHVVGADLVIDRSTGTSDGGCYIVTNSNVAHIRTYFLDDSEGLVSKD